MDPKFKEWLGSNENFLVKDEGVFFKVKGKQHVMGEDQTFLVKPEDIPESLKRFEKKFKAQSSNKTPPENEEDAKTKAKTPTTD